jgi:predicted dehydrogenase
VRFHHSHNDFGLRIEAHGREGSVVMLEDALRSQKVWAGKRGEELREVPVGPQPYDPPADAPEYVARHLPIFMALLDRLGKACRGQPQPDLATLEDGARVQAVMDAIRASHDSGRWEQVRQI